MGGCVLNRLFMLPPKPKTGLTMNICSVQALPLCSGRAPAAPQLHLWLWQACPLPGDRPEQPLFMNRK